MEENTQNILEKYINYSKINSVDEYTKVKKINIPQKTFYLDGFNKEELNLENDEILVNDIEILIKNFKNMAYEGSIKLPVIPKKLINNDKWNNYINLPKISFMNIYITPIPELPYIHILDNNLFINVKNIENKCKYIHSFIFEDKLISPFEFVVYSKDKNILHKSLKVDIDNIPNNVICRCINIFTNEIINRLNELQILLETQIDLNDFSNTKAYNEITNLKKSALIEIEKIKKNN